MYPIELRLSSLKHCFVQLPNKFRQTEKSLKPGSLVSIKSIQNDNELFVLWNGQISSGNYVELDLTFAKANKFSDELVVICFDNDNIQVQQKCDSCRVELLNNNDYNIIAEHSVTNLLESCKLINKNLIIPIWFLKNVSVLVKVVDFNPYQQQYAMLTDLTEMLFQHSFDKVSQKSIDEKRSVIDGEEKSLEKNSSKFIIPIEKQIPIISCSLGLNAYKTKLYLGSILICGERGAGKTYLLENILNKIHKNFNKKLFNCKQLRGKRCENIKKIFNELLNQAFEEQPFIIGLDDIDSFLSTNLKLIDEKGQEVIYNKKLVDIFCNFLKQLERFDDHPKGRNVILIATSKSLDILDNRISSSKGRKYFTEIINIKNPTLLDRINIIKNIINEHKQIEFNLNNNQLESICKNLNNFMPMDFRKLIERAIINCCSRLEFDLRPIEITEEDLIRSIENYVPFNLRNVSLKPKTSRTFSDIGGMNEIKEKLLKTISLQIKYPNLFKKFPLKMQASILLYGPPGCGKTLIAEALTNEENLNSICIRGPELLSKYIGASEGAVRDLFARAQLAKPCLIFFDEFESLVSKRGSDSTGVTDRIVNQFLTLMDGVEKLSNEIFIIAATSRPDMIDPAILRPGRLDKHIYCPIPNQQDRHEILKVLSKNINFENNVNLLDWSHKLENFTGADIQSFLYSAQLKALHELIGPTDFIRTNNKKLNCDKNLDIRVQQKHMDASFDEMKYNISERYLMLIKKYPKNFRKLNQQVVATRATLA